MKNLERHDRQMKPSQLGLPGQARLSGARIGLLRVVDRDRAPVVSDDWELSLDGLQASHDTGCPRCATAGVSQSW